MTAEWKSGTRYLVGIGLVLVVGYLVYLSRPVLPELVVAALVAFLVRPVIDFLRVRLRMPKAAAVTVTYILVALALLILPLVFLPHIVNAVTFVIGIDYQTVVDNTVRWLVETLTLLKVNGLNIFGVGISLQGVVDPVLAALENPGSALPASFSSITEILSSLISLLSRSAAGVVGTVAASLLSLIFVLLASVYLSVDGPKMIRSLLDGVPESFRPEMVELLERLRRVWDAFLRGQLLLMVIIGTVVTIGAAILGLPNALSLGLLAGFLELVPNLGPLLATIPAVLIALLQGSSYLPISNSWFALIVLVFYVIVQNLENAFIVPRVLGDAVKVHPLIILAGVLVGAASAGVLGILLAAPVIASLREILLYLYRKVLNLDPFDPDEPPAPEVHPRPSIRAWVAQLRQRMRPPAAEAVGVPADVREETLTTLAEAPGRAKAIGWTQAGHGRNRTRNTKPASRR
jgi:predicted PurR-regulated permease PerM